MKIFGVFLFLIICSSAVFSASVHKTLKNEQSGVPDVNASDKIQGDVKVTPAPEKPIEIENVPLKETQVPVQIIKDPVVPEKDEIVKVVKEESPQKDVKLESENKQEDLKIEETKEKEQVSKPSVIISELSEQVAKPSEQVAQPSEQVAKPSEPSEPVQNFQDKVTIYKQTPPANASQAGPIASISQIVQTGIQNFQQGIENLGQNIAGIIRPSQTPPQTPQQTQQEAQPPSPSIIQSIQGIFRPQSDSSATNPAPSVPSAIQQSLSNLQSTVSNGLTNITQSFQNVIRPSTTATADRPTLIEGLVQQLNTLRETIVGNFQSLTGTIQSSLNAPSQSPGVLQSVQTTVQNVSSTISSGIQNLLTPSQTSEDSRPGLVQSVVGGVAQRVQNGLVRLNETVQAIISPPRIRPQVNSDIANNNASKQGLNENNNSEETIKNDEKEFLEQVEKINEALREGVQKINEKIQVVVAESQEKNDPTKTEEVPIKSPVTEKDSDSQQVLGG